MIATVSPLQQLTLNSLHLPNGRQKDFLLTYQVFGQPLHQAPIVLVNHALTGNSTVCGPDGWWQNLIGENQTVDLNRYTVIAFNIPGNGYKTALLTDYKLYSTRFFASLFWKGLDQLQVRELYAVIGSSLGGGIAWEMTLLRPTSIQHLIPIATNIKASDWVIGNVLVQDEILNQVENPIALARKHAMLLYRSPASFTQKFNLQYKDEEEQYAVESWLNYHGRTLKDRFPLAAYKLMNYLLKTIGKGLTGSAIIRFAQETTTHIHSIAVDSDYLFTQAEQKETYHFLQHHGCQHIYYNEINSVHGHDAFLIEYKQLNQLLAPIF